MLLVRAIACSGKPLVSLSFIAFCCCHHENTRTQDHCSHFQLWEDGLHRSQKVNFGFMNLLSIACRSISVESNVLLLAVYLVPSLFLSSLSHLPTSIVRNSRGQQPENMLVWCRSLAFLQSSWTLKYRTWWEAVM